MPSFREHTLHMHTKSCSQLWSLWVAACQAVCLCVCGDPCKDIRLGGVQLSVTSNQHRDEDTQHEHTKVSCYASHAADRQADLSTPRRMSSSQFDQLDPHCKDNIYHGIDTEPNFCQLPTVKCSTLGDRQPALRCGHTAWSYKEELLCISCSRQTSRQVCQCAILFYMELSLICLTEQHATGYCIFGPWCHNIIVGQCLSYLANAYAWMYHHIRASAWVWDWCMTSCSH